MADLPVIPNVYRCAIIWGADAQHAVNVLHIESAGPTNAEDLIQAVVESATADMFRAMADQAVVGRIDVTPLDGTSATFARTLTADERGVWSGLSNTHYVPAASVLIKLQTAMRGKEKRGRIFLPFVAEAAILNGKLEPDYRGPMTSAWKTFANTLLDASVPCALVVASYKLASAEQVINIGPEESLGTQRRRQQRLR